MLLLSLFIATGSRRFFPFLICCFRRVDHHQTRIRRLSVAAETVSSLVLVTQSRSVSCNRFRLGWVTVFVATDGALGSVFFCGAIGAVELKSFQIGDLGL